MEKRLLQDIARTFLGREVADAAASDSVPRLDTIVRWVRGTDDWALLNTGPAGVFNPAHPAWRSPPPAHPAYATVRPTGAGSGYGSPPGQAGLDRRVAAVAGRLASGLPPAGEGPFVDADQLGLVAGDELAALPAHRLAAGLRRGEYTPTELLEQTLERIERLAPGLNAFITVAADRARADARAAARTLREQPELAGPLCGVPVAIKDIIETAGIRTTCGSRLLADHVPATDATVVRRLREAGAVVVGKTNTHEFAFGPTTVNPHYGACRNPYNPARISGGSSGGSAVALASGQAYLALGTDTGGSIRIPASACGLVGLKPTYGRVSKAGIFPLSWSLDHAGPLARNVADAALCLGVLAGADPLDQTTLTGLPTDDWLAAALQPEGGAKRVRIGVPAGWAEYRVSPEVRVAFESALKLLSGLGAEVTPIAFPPVDAMLLANRLLILAEAAAYHLPYLRERPDEYGADVRARLEMGQYLLAADYLTGQRLRAELCRAIAATMEHIDLIVTPSLPVTAPYIGQADISWDDGLETVPDAMIRFAAPFNITGQPALTVPCGRGADSGLPIGLQLVGRYTEEALLLRVGAAFEAALG